MKPSISEAIASLQKGQPVLCLLDGPSGSTRGVLILAAANATASGVNVLAREGRGVICVGIPSQTAERLNLGPMVPYMMNHETAAAHSVSTVSVDALHGTTTGISAGDRAITLQLLASESSTADDFIRPGHLFPYIVHPAGVLGRADAAEAAADLAQASGLPPVGAFCGVLDAEGRLADEDYLTKLAERTGIAVIAMADLVEYRLFTAPYLEECGREELITDDGTFELITFRDQVNDERHSVLVNRSEEADASPLVYVHRACVKGDVFGATHCRGRKRLHSALARVGKDGGVVVYVGSRTAPGVRTAAVAAQILRHLEYDSVRLLTPWTGLRESLGEARITVVDVCGRVEDECAHDETREAMALSR